MYFFITTSAKAQKSFDGLTSICSGINKNLRVCQCEYVVFEILNSFIKLRKIRFSCASELDYLLIKRL
jgi:hypothetical protein